MDIFLTHLYYDKLEYKNTIAIFLNIDNKDIKQLLDFPLEKVTETREYVLSKYVKQYGLIKSTVTQEMCEMALSKDYDSSKLGVDLLLSSGRPLNYKTFNTLCHVLTIIYNSSCSPYLKIKASVWAYVLDIGDYQNTYLKNVSKDFKDHEPDGWTLLLQ